ncbi:MAG: iron-sulfur cluster assembly accessory protein [Nitrospina sp.]|nr:iron-sulfur cluster assembly accessory protein [Nitrospina sp.]
MTTATQFVTITPLAAEEVKKLIAAEDKPGIGLRLGVKGGGCSGLSYDLGFTPQEAGDTVIENEGFKVFMDAKSLIYLKGMQLDYQGGLQGKGFVFVNPNAKSVCGCGESFSLT